MTPGDGFESILKEISPEIHEKLTEALEFDPNVSFKYDFCSRCGAGVVQAQQATHNQWHRDLTYSINFQLALLSNIANLPEP